MPPLSVALVLASCALHAYWNLLLKRAHDKLAFTVLFLAAAPVLYLPLFVFVVREARVTPLGWLCLAGTTVVYCAYYATLGLAYREGDLSFAYPVMRGVGPVVALAGGVAFLGDRPNAPGLAGVALILAAVLLLNRGAGRPAANGDGSAMAPPAIARGLWIALFVAGLYGIYSVVDTVAVSRAGVTPALYAYLPYVTTSALLFPWVARRRGLHGLAAEWRRSARPILGVAALNLFSYLLVLTALSIPGTPISYVAPLRAVSVLFAVLFGARLLGEGHLAGRLGAAVLMVLGIALMAARG